MATRSRSEQRLLAQKYLVIVPKSDEHHLIARALRMGNAEKRAVGPFTLMIRDSIALYLLDTQNNTRSGVLATELLNRVQPLAAFLVGTAMGRPSLPTPSVVVRRGIVRDLCETELRSPSPRDRTLETSADYNRLVDSLIEGDITSAVLRRAQKVLNKARPEAARLVPNTTNGEVLVFGEPIASANVYFNGEGPPAAIEADIRRLLWDHAPEAKVYDMEAAGFHHACAIRGTPGFIVRGVSDRGDASGFSRPNRDLASVLAGACAAEMIDRIESSPETQRALVRLRSGDLRRVRDRYDGYWMGGFAYIDDDGRLAVVRDDRVVLFQDREGRVSGFATSTPVVGDFPRQRQSEYAVRFQINGDGTGCGFWDAGDSDTVHRGTLMCALDTDHERISGYWTGSHKEGIRTGAFVWYNLARDEIPPEQWSQPMSDELLEQALREMLEA